MNRAAAIRDLRWLCAGLVLCAGAASGSVIEISASNLPRFDTIDGSNRTQQRLDMALLSPGRASFGVKWRYVFDNTRRIDITAWRDLGRPNDALALIQSRDTGYGARVEMQLAGSRSPLVADRGFIGLQLDGGARITLRRSGGRPMVYYRNKF